MVDRVRFRDKTGVLPPKPVCTWCKTELKEGQPIIAMAPGKMTLLRAKLGEPQGVCCGVLCLAQLLIDTQKMAIELERCKPRARDEEEPLADA